MKKALYYILGLLLAPVVLFLLLAGLLMLPPVQNWAVDQVASVVSEKTGMQVTVGHVRLRFPLDLSLDDFLMVHQGDTLADVRHLVADVQLRPLLDRRVVINELALDRTRLNTNGFIDAVRIGVPWRGSGYSRVLYRPRDDDGGESRTPVHLVIETSLEPATPNTLTSVVHYDRRGYITSLFLTEYGYDSYWRRVEASINYDNHRLSVYKIEERDGRHPHGRLLYKRRKLRDARDIPAEEDRDW